MQTSYLVDTTIKLLELGWCCLVIEKQGCLQRRQSMTQQSRSLGPMPHLLSFPAVTHPQRVPRSQESSLPYGSGAFLRESSGLVSLEMV